MKKTFAFSASRKSVDFLDFTNIQPTEHYLNEHQKDIPWDDVIEIILCTKNPRKKEGKFEIEMNKYYILFRIENNTIFVINAKRK
jgi:hypothetical protein